MQIIQNKKSARWYDKNGNPVNEVPYADPEKGMRPTTLADAKKLNLSPSVTSVIAIKSKPAINQWRENNLLLQALTLEKPKDTDLNEWAKEIVRQWEEENAKGRDLGSLVHKLIERVLRFQAFDELEIPDREKYIEAIAKLQTGDRLKDADKLRVEETERSFVSPLGFAGTIDFIGYFEGKRSIIDFKTQSVKNGEVAIYRDWLMQLCAYYYGAFTPQKDALELINVVFSTTKPGEYFVIRWPREEIVPAWVAFQASLALWTWENKFFK